MLNLLVAFITGLTTGGLSCLAVQGGLLASSLANQIERDIADLPGRNRHKGTAIRSSSHKVAQPILLFLAAKLAAYTLFGFLLGALGSVLQLTPLTRAILQIAIGVFMVGSALRMFNVHPIFRYFSFEPPAFITRYIRKKAKSGTAVVTPLFMGVLTVLIPCGVTQAMMALAVGTASPLMGAALMFAFTLGTSPVFFTVAYLATRLGSKLEVGFMKVVAVVVLILGLVSIETGLNLAGSPVSLSNLMRSLRSPEPVAAAAPAPPTGGGFTLLATDSGYEPQVVYAKADTQLTLTVETNDTRSCSRAFVIPALNVNVLLPMTGKVPLEIPPHKAGTVIPFSCSMGMYTGQIVFQ